MTQLANLGVIAGLVVLIIEVRQNNELAMAQIEQSRSEAFLSWRQEEVLNEFVGPLIATVDQLANEMYGADWRYPGLMEETDAASRQERTASILERLEGADRVRFISFVVRSYWDFENLYSQYQRGLVSDDYWSERIAPSILLNAPDWKAVLGGRLPVGRRDFNVEVERLLKEQD
jgi:hypothetical protein